jgi:hypothetical protein
MMTECSSAAASSCVLSVVGESIGRTVRTSPPVPSSGSVSCTKSLIKVDLPVQRLEERRVRESITQDEVKIGYIVYTGKKRLGGPRNNMSIFNHSMLW